MASPTRVNPFLRPAPGFYPGGQRRRLLDQLRHLSQWSRRALLVLGPPGTGKTMLFNQLGQEMGDAALLTQLDGRALNAELDVLIVLAEALGVDVPDSFSTELLKPLVEAALTEQESSDQPLVVLVDDADQLDPTAMRLLLALCGAHRFRLLLFGQQGLPEQIRTATRDLDVAPYETSLLAFSPVDSRAYLEWRCEQAGIKGGLPFSEEQISELYRRSNGIPGELNRLAGQLLERIYDGEQTAARLSFPATHLYLVAGLAAVLALSFLLLDRVPLTEEVVTENIPIAGTREQPPPATAPVVGSIDRTPLPEPERRPEAATPAAERAAQQVTDAVAAAAPTTDAASEPASERPFVAAQPIALPEPAPAESTMPTEPSTPEPVAAGAAVSEPAPAETAAPADTGPTTASAPAASEPADLPAAGSVAVTETETETETERVAETARPVAADADADGPAPVVPPAPRPKLDQPITLAAATDSVVSEVPGLKDGTWLLAQDESSYTLQLVTLSSRDGLLRYLKRQADPEQFAVYAREVGGRLLYVVTFGNYANRPDAEAASRRLPAEVGKIKPWIRPFAEVQNAVSAGP